MDFRYNFDDLSIIVDGKPVGLFSGQFEMAIDSTGDAYIELVNVDTTDDQANLILREANRDIVSAFMFAMLTAALNAKYRSVLDAYADANAPPDCGYGPSQRERM